MVFVWEKKSRLME
jgi:hypothetical protein